MPVDGEPVVDAVGGQCPDRDPFRQQAPPQPSLIERLDDRDGRLACQQEVDEQGPRLGGPRNRDGRLDGGERLERPPLDRYAVRGRRRPDPESQQRIVQRRVGAEADLLPAKEDAGHDLSGALGAPRARSPQGRGDAPPGVVAGPGDGTCRLGDAAHQRIGIGIAEGRGHAGLLLEREDVAGPPRLTLQFHPGVEQDRLPGRQARSVELEQHPVGSLGPPQRMNVTEAAAALLQVGLDLEGHLPGLVVSLRHPLAELGKPVAGMALPRGAGAVRQAGRQPCITGDVAGSQQRGGGVEVARGQAQRLLRRRDAVAEVQALLPDRVPDGIGDRRHVGMCLVEEHDVDVAARGKLGAPVAPDRHERQPGRLAERGLLEELREPGVDEVRVRPAPGRSRRRGVGQQCAALREHDPRVLPRIAERSRSNGSFDRNLPETLHVLYVTKTGS